MALVSNNNGWVVRWGWRQRITYMNASSVLSFILSDKTWDALKERAFSWPFLITLWYIGHLSCAGSHSEIMSDMYELTSLLFGLVCRYESWANALLIKELPCTEKIVCEMEDQELLHCAEQHYSTCRTIPDIHNVCTASAFWFFTSFSSSSPVLHSSSPLINFLDCWRTLCRIQTKCLKNRFILHYF